MTAPPTEPLSSRSARRLALRDELARGRAALRTDRAATAAEATRLPRWRPSRGKAAEVPLAAPPPPESEAQVPLPAERASVYASLLRDAGVGDPPAEAPEPEPEAAAAPAPEPALPEPALPEPALPEPASPEAAAPTLDLSEIAELGPGMRARLRLLGCLDIADLAQAEPEPLREALGEISRLLNVEAWIAEARRLAARPD
jgi:predicted flap endonuclease-1-like 5' DNA nuclease